MSDPAEGTPPACVAANPAPEPVFDAATFEPPSFGPGPCADDLVEHARLAIIELAGDCPSPNPFRDLRGWLLALAGCVNRLACGLNFEGAAPPLGSLQPALFARLTVLRGRCVDAARVAGLTTEAVQAQLWRICEPAGRMLQALTWGDVWEATECAADIPLDAWLRLDDYARAMPPNDCPDPEPDTEANRDAFPADEGRTDPGPTLSAAALNLLLGAEAVEILNIAQSGASCDDRMRRICGIDTRFLEHDSHWWAELFGVTPQAVRKTRFWTTDRPLACEAERGMRS